MISVTKLVCGGDFDSDYLRYKQNLNKTAFIVAWNITRACNLECKHCYIEAKEIPGKGELSTKEAKKLIDDLADLKVKVLLFSGGEPLLRKDIFSLSKCATGYGIRTVLSTNGTLITSKIARKIKKAGFSYVGISLDGSAQTNDEFRGKKGAFKKALGGIKSCHAQNIKTGIRFTLAKHTIKDIPFIFELLEKENVSRICFYHLVCTGRAKKLTNQTLSLEQSRREMDTIAVLAQDLFSKNKKSEVLTADNHTDGPYLYLKSLKEFPARSAEILRLLKLNQGNGSGVRLACISHTGEVYPDQFWNDSPLGNVKKRKFSEIWQDNSNKLLLKLRNRKSQIKGRCAHCQFFDICNGNLRARAKALNDDLWAEDPACYLTNQEIEG